MARVAPLFIAKRTEGMPSRINAGQLHTRSTCSSCDDALEKPLCQRSTIGLAQHKRRSQVPMSSKCVSEAMRHRNVSQPSAFRRRRMALPDRALHAENALLKSTYAHSNAITRIGRRRSPELLSRGRIWC
jgi:hypothetical protein